MLEDEEGGYTPLAVDQSLYYIQQILQAVHYLHSNSILHCNIESTCMCALPAIELHIYCIVIFIYVYMYVC